MNKNRIDIDPVVMEGTCVKSAEKSSLITKHTEELDYSVEKPFHVKREKEKIRSVKLSLSENRFYRKYKKEIHPCRVTMKFRKDGKSENGKIWNFMKDG